jgi:ABC-type multidrug transport system fused ATPase/permease subunit
MVSNPLMKLLKNENEEKSKARKIRASAIAKGLLEYAALKEIANAISSLLSLFILFPLQLVAFYLFVKGLVMHALAFTVGYCSVVIFALYKILTKSLSKSKSKSH